MSVRGKVTRRRAVMFAAVGMLLLPAWNLATAQKPAAKAKKATVSLTIDFGDGFQMRYTRLKWRPSMTVLDVLHAAKNHAHPLAFKFRGRGATAFVTAIEDVENGGAKGPNWIFRVDGKLGDRSCGAYPVQAGQKVLWSLEKYP